MGDGVVVLALALSLRCGWIDVAQLTPRWVGPLAAGRAVPCLTLCMRLIPPSFRLQVRLGDLRTQPRTLRVSQSAHLDRQVLLHRPVPQDHGGSRWQRPGQRDTSNNAVRAKDRPCKGPRGCNSYMARESIETR